MTSLALGWKLGDFYITILDVCISLNFFLNEFFLGHLGVSVKTYVNVFRKLIL